MRITRDHVKSGIVMEHDVHRFLTESSDLQLPIGCWPEKIPTDLGNGLDLVRTSKKVNRDGDILYVRYFQTFGCIDLIIYND